MQEAQVQALLRQTQVTATKDYHKWDWSLILELLKGLPPPVLA